MTLKQPKSYPNSLWDSLLVQISPELAETQPQSLQASISDPKSSEQALNHQHWLNDTQTAQKLPKQSLGLTVGPNITRTG